MSQGKGSKPSDPPKPSAWQGRSFAATLQQGTQSKQAQQPTLAAPVRAAAEPQQKIDNKILVPKLRESEALGMQSLTVHDDVQEQVSAKSRDLSDITVDLTQNSASIAAQSISSAPMAASSNAGGMHLQPNEIVQRKAAGTVGQQVSLMTNFFAMNFKPKVCDCVAVYVTLCS